MEKLSGPEMGSQCLDRKVLEAQLLHVKVEKLITQFNANSTIQFNSHTENARINVIHSAPFQHSRGANYVTKANA